MANKQASKKVEVKDETPAPEKVTVSKSESAPKAPAREKAPDGIDWFSIETGETIYTTRPAAIKAFINSSIYGPNVHAGQDRGWRLGPIWLKKLERALEDPELSSVVDLYTDEEGRVNNYPGLIMALWNREVKLRARRERTGNKAAFADRYREITGQ